MRHVRSTIHLFLTAVLIGGMFVFPAAGQAAASKDVVLVGSSSFSYGCHKSYGFVKNLKKEVGNIFECKYPKSGDNFDDFKEQCNKI